MDEFMTRALNSGVRARSSALRSFLNSVLLPLAIGVFGLGVIALVWGGLLYEDRQERESALNQARKDTANLVIAFRENIRRTITSIDALMVAMATDYAADPDHYRLPDSLAKSPLLTDMTIQIGIIGKDGYLRETSLDNLPAGRLDLSDREHFRYHLDPAAAQPFISRPVMGRGSKKMSIQISRRLERADGSFAGVLVVSLDPYYLSRFFEMIDLGEQGVVSLVGRDGIVRARRTRQSTEIGQDIGGTPLFEHLSRADHGTYVIRHAQTDGRERIYSYSAVPGYPLVVAAGVGMDDFLAGVRAQRTSHLLFGIGMSVVILLLTALLMAGTVQRRRREIGIAETASLFQTVLDVTPAAIWVKDAAGRFEMINRALAQTLGRPAHEIIGHTSSEMLPADAGRMVKGWDDAALADPSQTIEGQHSYSDDGRLQDVLTWRRACEIAGRLRVVGSAMNVTSLRRAEAALRREMRQREAAEAELRQAQKMDALGNLTGGVAHDFNNLLTTVLGNIELAQRQPRSESQLRLLQNAQRGAERGAKLVQHLLAFARKQRLQPRAVDLNDLVLGMTELFRHHLGAEIRVETRLHGALWPALADANQVEAAILNIALNARDAMPMGGRLLLETANCASGTADRPTELPAPSDYVLLTVTDDGQGMSEDVLTKVFDPFFTTKEPGKGTGLGLSQVYGLALQSGGTVRIDSKIGEGTSVRLYLPRAAELTPKKHAVRAAAQQSRGSARTVLVVDDDDAVREFAATCVAECGHRVLEAPSGEVALKLFETTGIDAAIVDIVMPEMSGPEMIRRAREQHPGLSVLFMTGMSDPSFDHELGPILEKPFRAETLIAELDRVLEREGETATSES